MALAARTPDIILRPSIPLSATSDQPLAEVVRPPESASNDATDQASGTSKEITPQALAEAENARKADPATADDAVDPGAENEGTEGKKEGDPAEKKAAGDDADGSDLPKDLPGYAVREITKVRKAARAAREAIQAEADAAKAATKVAEETAATARRELDELRAKVPVETKVEEPATDPRPTRDTFDDPDAYDEAMVEWGKREGARAAEKQVAEAKEQAETAAKQKAHEAEQAERDTAVAELNTKWTEARTKAIEKYSDYADVAEAAPEDGGPLISEAMAVAIVQSGNGTDIAYYLGQNTDEAARINGLKNPVLHFVEIGKLSERLANPQRRRAPRVDPIEPIDTNTAPADTSERELDMDAYAAQRNRALNTSRRPFFPPTDLH